MAYIHTVYIIYTYCIYYVHIKIDNPDFPIYVSLTYHSLTAIIISAKFLAKYSFYIIIQLLHPFEVDITICQPENSDVH